MDRIGDLNLFLRVLDLQSISAAARSLGISVALASQRLKRLERELGLRLLHRTTRRLQVTPEGAALAAQGRPLIEDLEALTGGLRSAAQEVSGQLRVAIPASFGRLYISPLLPEFLKQHPRLELHVVLGDQNVDLVQEGFDLAIRIGSLSDSALVARRLAANRRVLCAAPEYLARRGRPNTAAALSEHDCILLAGGSSWPLIAPDGTPCRVRVRGRLVTNLGEVTRDAALAGMGIALHSTWHVCEDLRAARLEQVLPDYRVADSAIYAVMPQRRLVLPRARAFADFLARHFGDDPPWERHLRAAASHRKKPRR